MQILCSFIGHRKIKNEGLVEMKLFSLVEELIKKGFNGFIFGSNSQFDDLAYKVVMELRKKHTHIKVFNFYCGNEKPLETRYFDKIHFPKNCENAGRKLYVERNKAMINISEAVVFYYEDDYVPISQTTSGTRLAYNYAVSSKKEIFNLYQKHIFPESFS